MSLAAMEHFWNKSVNDWPRLATSGASRHNMAASRVDFFEVRLWICAIVDFDWVLLEHAPTQAMTSN